MAGIEMRLEAAASKGASGTLLPSAGGSVTVRPSGATRLDVALDYSSPDRLVVKLGGTFSVLHDKLDVTGDVAANLLDGKTDVTGTVTYAIDKDVAVSLSTRVGGGEISGSAGITLRF